MKQIIKDIAISLLVAMILFALNYLRGKQIGQEVNSFVSVITGLFTYLEIRFLRKRLAPKQKRYDTGKDNIPNGSL